MYSQSDSIAAIAAALCAARKDFKRVVKDTINPFYKSQYATLPSVIEATDDALSANGIAVVQGLGFDAGNCTITTNLIHSSGEWVRSIAESPLAKQDAQGVGSAATYLRRYSLQALLNIASEEDDDANAASGKQERQVQRATPTVSQIHPSAPFDEDFDVHMAQAAAKVSMEPQIGPSITAQEGKRLYATAMNKPNWDVAKYREFINRQGFSRDTDIPQARLKEIIDRLKESK